MNYIDFFIILVVILGVVSGFRKGFIHQLASLVAIILGIFLAAKFAKAGGSLLSQYFAINPNLVIIVAFVIIMILVIVAIHYLGKMIEKIIEEVELKMINRLAGCIFALAKNLLLLSLLFLILDFSSPHLNILSEEKKDNSLLYKPVAAIAPIIIPYFGVIKTKKILTSTGKVFNLINRNS